MRDAISPASAADLAILTPPPLPRPPAWICAFTTTPLAPEPSSDLAALSASSRVVTISPRGTATPYLARIVLAWYSWIFMNEGCGFRGSTDQSTRLRQTRDSIRGERIGQTQVSGERRELVETLQTTSQRTGCLLRRVTRRIQRCGMSEKTQGPSTQPATAGFAQDERQRRGKVGD